MTPPAGDATDTALVERYRPVYQLHPEEMWYPCHPEDQLRCADLVRVSDGAVIIPALKDGAGSVADQLLCTPLGLSQLQARGVRLDKATINMLASGQTPSAYYLRRPGPAGKGLASRSCQLAVARTSVSFTAIQPRLPEPGYAATAVSPALSL